VEILSQTQLAVDAEPARLAAVRRYDILDTPPDGSFDAITAMAAELFETPISIISLVDHDRIWFKSAHGLPGVPQIDRGPGLCASAIMNEEPWHLADASTDPRSLANPLVAGDFGLRFYLGVPLRTHDGFNLGTLCVIAKEPRTVSEGQIAHLKRLASLVMDQMELRLAARSAVQTLSQTLAEKESALERADMMTKEIEHRVMNSLQMISGLLSLQSRAQNDVAAREQLAIAAGRISAVAQVHRHIYVGGTEPVSDVGDYLDYLCTDLVSALALPRPIRVDAASTTLGTEKIAALGLIVNELVTNAAKHGGGEILVGFACENAICTLTVEDNGRGFAEDYDPAQSSGLGMRIISAQAQQLGGSLAISRGTNGRGARFTIAFPRTAAH
jgi:two-component sensor histidine kinase